ncbi:hypothetical protein [Patiriisocius marinus]|nr:hypothetical protein [Patiriisocius marinus]
MKITKILIAITITVSFYSCQKDSDFEQNQEPNIQSFISIANLDKRMEDLISSSANENNEFRNPCHFVIITWDGWGRKSLNCDGWGLCDAEWFFWDCSNQQLGSTGSPLQFQSSTNRPFVDILFDEPIPSNVAIEDLALAIDEEFQVYIESEQINLTFKAQVYSYNETLGDYGGIRIYLD